jgi:CDGSH-type Zn-finger protein
MARIVKLEATGPVKVDPSDKPIFVCACGLSKKFPFCDGSHKPTRAEEPGCVYRYSGENNDKVEKIDSPSA